jgi:prepilin-type N-terminal cleavage/methylation domain-containing protein
MKMERFRASQGFTMVEILFVTAILGLAMVSILGLYQSTQRSAYTQEEVVEVQQNLRVAMDMIVRDLRMAGFMIPTDEAPISAAASNSITLQTASPFGKVARIGADQTIPSSVPTELHVAVGLGDMSDLFEAPNKVRIIRPPNQVDLLGNIIEVKGKDRDVPRITFKDLAADDANIELKAGDIIARVPEGSVDFPCPVTYSLSGTELLRNDGGSNQPVADKISGLAFTYIMDDGTRNTSVLSDLQDIRAVEITLTGATEDTAVGHWGDAKNRELTNFVTLRNRNRRD